jgi:hypothetical protein
MRVEPEALPEIVSQIAPDVSITADTVAEEHRRLSASLTPRLVE